MLAFPLYIPSGFTCSSYLCEILFNLWAVQSLWESSSALAPRLWSLRGLLPADDHAVLIQCFLFTFSRCEWMLFSPCLKLVFLDLTILSHRRPLYYVSRSSQKESIACMGDSLWEILQGWLVEVTWLWRFGMLQPQNHIILGYILDPLLIMHYLPLCFM